MPGGNGIATQAFAGAGFDVTTVEPNPSASVGRGAIAHVLAATGRQARIVDAWGEALPFDAASFDAVYVRQGLHHASDLAQMLREIARVLAPGGVLLACREHVVDDYGPSLRAFLASQVDHQLYGGENAFTLADYRAAIAGAGLQTRLELGPNDSIINAYPNTPEVLREKILASRPGRLLRTLAARRRGRGDRRLACEAAQDSRSSLQLPGGQGALMLNALIPYAMRLRTRFPRFYARLVALARRFLGTRLGVYPRLLAGEVGAVTAVLRGSQWNMTAGSGLAHERLEAAFADYVGVPHAIAVNTGGMALQMSMRALGLGPGDEVVHQVDTCSATALAVMAAGCTPIFADLSPRTLMLERATWRGWPARTRRR